MPLWKIRVAQLATVGIIVAAWQIAGGGLLISTPGAVALQYLDWLTNPARWFDISLTLKEAMLGFVFGITLAILLASMISASRIVEVLLSPYIRALSTLPKIALAPLFILLFGLGTPSKVYFVTSVILFLPLFSILAGLKAIDRTYIDNAKMLGAGRLWAAWDVYMPAIAGVVIGDLRITVAWAFLAAVVSEFIASTGGIGHVIHQGQSNLRNDIVLAGILLVSTLIFGVDRMLLAVQQKFVSWRLQ